MSALYDFPGILLLSHDRDQNDTCPLGLLCTWYHNSYLKCLNAAGTSHLIAFIPHILQPPAISAFIQPHIYMHSSSLCQLHPNIIQNLSIAQADSSRHCRLRTNIRSPRSPPPAPQRPRPSSPRTHQPSREPRLTHFLSWPQHA